jgi:hypothetical protein
MGSAAKFWVNCKSAKRILWVITSMIFTREYHHRWQKEINWLLRNINQPAPPPKDERFAEISIALAIIRALQESMPIGMDRITLRRVTSCEEDDIDAMILIMRLVPGLTHRFALVDGLVFLLAN